MKNKTPVATMYRILCIIIGTLIVSCNNKHEAMIRALQNQVDDWGISWVGESNVAKELLKQQYAEYKERLVKIKTLKSTMTRRADECDAVSRRLNDAGKSEFSQRQLNMAATYRTNISNLAAKEIEATETLKNFAAEYENLTMEISMINEEIAAERAIGGISNDLGVDSPVAKRMDTVRELISKLKEKLDRAKALTEVNNLEANLK